MEEKIIMTFAPGGAVTVAVKGHKGPGCKELTKKIERALGEVENDSRTPEYREAAQENARARARARA